MQLFVSPTSPFARLVRVIRLEKALTDEISLEWVDPWASPDPLTRANPYSQVPALQLADGTTIVDSLVIASFLENRFPEPALMPAATTAAVHHKLGLGKVLIDAAVDLVITKRFRPQPDSDPILDRRRAAIERAVPAIAGCVTPVDQLDLGDIALAVALAYLDFRFPDIEWRAAQPELARWADELGQRPALMETRPPAS